MKSILAFEAPEEAAKYDIITKELMAKLKGYQHVLEEHYQLTAIPKGVLWTTGNWRLLPSRQYQYQHSREKISFICPQF